MSRAARIALAVSPFLAGAIAMLFVPPIAQDPAYHRFADSRPWLGIPNFGVVVSNLAFVAAGMAGLVALRRAEFGDARERTLFAVHFAAQALTGLGSAYYHWAPDDARLFWDRLPLTAAILSFLAAVVAERVSVKAGRRLLVPLLAAGAASLLWWMGTGDLRMYAIAQYGPMVAIPLLAMLLPPRYTRGADLFAVVGWYALAKACEALDRPIFDLFGGAVSGHTFKHLLAGVGAFWIVRMVRLRKRVDRGPG